MLQLCCLNYKVTAGFFVDVTGYDLLQLCYLRNKVTAGFFVDVLTILDFGSCNCDDVAGTHSLQLSASIATASQ